MFVPTVTQLAMQPVMQLAPQMHQSVMQLAMPCAPTVMPGCAQQMAVPQFALQLDVSRVPSGGLPAPQFALQPDVSRVPSGGLPAPQFALQPDASRVPSGGLPAPQFALQPDASRAPSGGLAAPAQPQPAWQPAAQPLAPAPEGGIDASEVLQAVESLYRDQLRPYGRILRKRLVERAAQAGQGAADVDARRLQQACQACPWLQTQDESGGDWSVLLRGRADRFVNVYSPEDCYPAELWEAARAYFAGLDERSMALPGGRYSCAQALVGRRLPFLAGLSLGQVCHIVQLAISQKKLLGYLGGAVVPYGRSQSMRKERCAERQRPCNSGSRGGASLATWDMVRAFLRDVLDGMGGSDSVPLSNIKRMFRSRFRAELSETSLGHSKLSELLQDSRVADLCALRLQRHGYVVLPLPRPAPASAVCLAGSLSAPIALHPVIVAQAPPARPRGRPAPLSLEESGEETGELRASAVAPGGLAPEGRAPAALLFPPTPDGEAPRRACRGEAPEQAGSARPLPVLLGRCAAPAFSCGAAVAKDKAGASGVAGRIKAARPQPLEAPSEEVDIWTVPLVTPSTLGHIRESLCQNTFVSMPERPTTPDASRCRARSAGR